MLRRQRVQLLRLQVGTDVRRAVFCFAYVSAYPDTPSVQPSEPVEDSLSKNIETICE